MSNLAKQALKIPENVFVKKVNDSLIIRGDLGKKKISLLTEVCLTDKGLVITDMLLPKFKKEKFKLNPKALQGTTAALIKQYFRGLSSGYRKHLKLVGVGYKVSVETINNFFVLVLKLGYSHSVLINIPSSLKVTCSKNTLISISGVTQQEVNNFAAVVRSRKKPEPYKGKGILYQDEKIVLKEGKRS
jgi:large subunit ribosomal protein L6